MFARFAIVTTLLLSACVTRPDPYLQVHAGMSQPQVLNILGQPKDRGFVNDTEQWSYEETDWSGDTRAKLVSFKNGKVIALTNDELALQRRHEIERAKAGATNISVSSGYGGYQGYGWANKKLRCNNSNVFGEYPQGGGCNTFGCWPSGGSCGAFGCSSQGSCGAMECQNKITSLDCE